MGRISPDWNRPGYHPVEGRLVRLERVPGGRVVAFMTGEPDKILQLRNLAARLRGYAADTSVKIFQDKFHAMADALEDEARRAEEAAQLQAELSALGQKRASRH